MITVCLDSENGGGKTTVAASLVKRLQVNNGLRATCIKRPLPDSLAYLKIQELYAKGERGSPECERLMLEDCAFIRNMLKTFPADIAIIDRDWLSQVAYGGADFWELNKEFGLCDLTVRLYARPITLLRRISARKKYKDGTPEPGHTLGECIENAMKYDAVFENVKEVCRQDASKHYMLIDTGVEHLTPEHISASIANMIMTTFFK